MFGSFAQHDLRALFQRESRDARSNSGKRDGLEAPLVGDAQAMRGGTAQGRRLGRSAKPHAGGVNDEARFQVAAVSDGRIAHGNAANFVALALDGIAAFAPYRSSNATAENQIVVSGIDDGVGVHLGEVALLDNDSVGE